MNNIISKLNNIAMDTLISNPGKARRYAQEALRMAEEGKNKDGIAEAYNTLGTLSLAEKKYENALGSFYKALDYYTLKGEKKGIAKTHINIGLYHLYKNSFYKAVTYFEKAQLTYSHLRDSAGQAAAYAHIASCYRELGKPMEAIMNQRKSFSVLEDNEQGKQRSFTSEAAPSSDVVDKYNEDIEKLQKEIEFRNREIASYSIVLKQKNEILGHIKGMVSNFIAKANSSLNAEQIKELNEILYKLRVNINTYGDNDWKNFKLQFERIHPNFFTKLARDYPALSQNELRHCAFLRMNMNNKEVAKLLGINSKSVEIARYRIKKKLGLPRKTRLFNYITQF